MYCIPKMQPIFVVCCIVFMTSLNVKMMPVAPSITKATIPPDDESVFSDIKAPKEVPLMICKPHGGSFQSTDDLLICKATLQPVRTTRRESIRRLLSSSAPCGRKTSHFCKNRSGRMIGCSTTKLHWPKQQAETSRLWLPLISRSPSLMKPALLVVFTNISRSILPRIAWFLLASALTTSMTVALSRMTM